MSERPRHVAVIIVGYRNSADVRACLCALSKSTPHPSFDIFICENGGAAAFEELKTALTSAEGPCEPYSGDTPAIVPREKFVDIRCAPLKGRQSVVWTACAADNLGYAGAINAWLKQLKAVGSWDGVWVLNPDTKPYPDALQKMVHHAAVGNKGMVSCTLVPSERESQVHNRGLYLNKILSRTTGIGNRELVCEPYDQIGVERRMDSPSGASMYVTRTCIERIGPMDERFFLYYEDIDWGLRAKKECGLGYAGEAIVLHEGGTTIGKSSAHRKSRSRLTVYLENRNRILFVKKHFPLLTLPASFMAIAHALLYLFSGSLKNFEVAVEGVLAGWNGEIGPPPHARRGHLWALLSGVPGIAYRRAKLAISLLYYCGQVARRLGHQAFGRPSPSRLNILYYHGVSDNHRFGFARQMSLLSRLANVVPADFSGSLSSAELNVAITFDDAFASVLDNALPELRRYSFPSTIFVPVALIGRKPNWFVDDGTEISDEIIMTDEQLRALSPASVSIGAHGFQHLHLARIDQHQAKMDIEQARNALARLIGREVSLFAFPYGDYDQRVLEICKNAGFRNVYTTEAQSVACDRREFARGRVKVDPTDGELEFFLKVNGAYNWIARTKLIASWWNKRVAADTYSGDGL